ncbi:MAG: protein translocase subunit SecD, partial [Proteobacteria bacterium]|nr:protein translocase subunit SecD [Pseudomonadota bacterium]
MKTLSWRIWFIVGLALLSIYLSAPTIIYFLQPKDVRGDLEKFQSILPGFLIKDHVKLGLDIQGGVQLILDVDTDSAVDNYLAKLAVEVKRWSDEKYSPSSPVTSSYHLKNERRLVLVTNFDQSPVTLDQLIVDVREDYSSLIVVSKEPEKLILAYTEENVQRIGESSLEQAERVIRSRVDKWGVADPLIHRRQNGSILVQLPGFKNPEKAKELLGRTAQLQFKIVDDVFTGFSEIDLSSLPEGITLSETGSGVQRVFVGEDRNQLTSFLSAYVPEDRRLLFEQEFLAGNRIKWSSLVVMATTEITGSDIMDAFVGQGSGISSSPMVFLRFSALGSKRFAEVTGQNVGKRMAIVLDDVVESAPNIEQKISGGEASITMGGGRSYDEIFSEAQQLALILKSGSVPATIKIMEERQVGSTLGPDLAKKGILGILVGLFAVLLFMVFYYFRPGVLACLVLVLNGLLLLSAMASFGFALTLPGIAGFILTLGMAVDANVLINERIRQELAQSRNAKKSIEQAFKKVFWTIVDANFTTLIACTILLSTNSSGPIRGFAITLLVGLLISLFTSLYVTRVLLTSVLAHKGDAAIRAWFKGARKHKIYQIPFLSFALPVSIGVGVLALMILATTAFK